MIDSEKLKMENNLRKYLKENDITVFDALIRFCSAFEIFNAVILTEIGQLEKKHLQKIISSDDEDEIYEIIRLMASCKSISNSLRI